MHAGLICRVVCVFALLGFYRAEACRHSGGKGSFFCPYFAFIFVKLWQCNEKYTK